MPRPWLIGRQECLCFPALYRVGSFSENPSVLDQKFGQVTPSKATGWHLEQVKVLVQDLARNRLDEELRSGSAKMIVVKLHQVPRLVADSDQAAVFVAKRLHW
jgi:hypothetical protein